MFVGERIDSINVASVYRTNPVIKLSDVTTDRAPLLIKFSQKIKNRMDDSFP